MNSALRRGNSHLEVGFSDEDFARIAKLAKTDYGLNIGITKKPLVYSRLVARVRMLKLNSFSDYCAILETKSSREELSHLLSALTTNVTHFFREIHHFEYLAEKILPNLIRRAEQGESIRIWSSACSAGQEAFSIAATLLKYRQDISKLDVRILATDIDTKMIKHARSAKYHTEQLEAIPKDFRKIMLAGIEGKGTLDISPRIQEIVTFSELNLIDHWPLKRKCDVIFCRNAAIYFDKPTQARLWHRFAEQLKDGGYLMIGHSERINGVATDLFESVGVTTYRKRPA